MCYDYFMGQAASDFQKSMIEKLREYFAGQDCVAAVYLFGSAAGERSAERSDIDVGVLFHSDSIPGLDQRLQQQEELSERLQRPVDLVVLNQASPILGYQVLKYWERLLTQDSRAVNAFFVRTLNEYFDLKQNRRVIEQALHKTRIL